VLPDAVIEGDLIVRGSQAPVISRGWAGWSRSPSCSSASAR
jgi:hypothetical protein